MGIKETVLKLKSQMMEAGIDPHNGLPESVFLFASSITPIVNIDLFICNKDREVLLSWRDDRFFGSGWHIPGGCIRIGEKLSDRVKKTALNEVHTEVFFDENCFIVRESINSENREGAAGFLERGHGISFLYNCSLPEGYEIRNSGNYEHSAGFLKWFDHVPDDLLLGHKILYGDVLSAWFGRKEVVFPSYNGQLQMMDER